MVPTSKYSCEKLPGLTTASDTSDRLVSSPSRDTQPVESAESTHDPPLMNAENGRAEQCRSRVAIKRPGETAGGNPVSCHSTVAS